MYKQGDIVSVLFPFTDLSSSKLRPAIIVSNNAHSNDQDFIVAMITSKEKFDGLNVEVKTGNLSKEFPKRSFVRCNKIATLHKNLITGKVSEVIEAEFLEEIIEGIISVIKEKKHPYFYH